MTGLYILLAHLIGDYVLQTNWMAQEKTKRWPPAIAHGVLYTLPYGLITQSPLALLVIGGTHMIIDRYRLAKYVTWAVNQVAPKRLRYRQTDTGYPETMPVWLSGWLLILVDNTVHLLINTAAVVWL